MIEIGDRVFYYQSSDTSGFGLVVDVVLPNASKKYPGLRRSNRRILVILKDNGRLEEYIDEDCKKVMEM